MNRKYVIFTILILSLIAGFVGSAGIRDASPVETTSPDVAAPAQSVDISTIQPRNYPSVDGSTSTLPLQVTIACEILKVPCAWVEGDFFSSNRRIAPVDTFMEFEEREAIFEIIHNGTHDSYVNLILTNADLILVARERRGGYWGLLFWGVFLTLAGLLKHIPEIVKPEPYWSGWFSEMLILGMMAAGVMTALAAAMALRSSRQREAT